MKLPYVLRFLQQGLRVRMRQQAIATGLVISPFLQLCHREAKRPMTIES